MEKQLPQNIDEMLEIAMESVVSEDQAKDIVDRKALDSWLIKLRVDLESKCGIMMVLVSKMRRSILRVYSLFGVSPVIKKIRTFEDFKQLSSDMVNAQKEGGIEKPLSEALSRIIYRTITTDLVDKQANHWDKNNTEYLIPLVQEGIASSLKVRNAQVNIDIEKVSSVEFRLHGDIKNLLTPMDSPFQDDKTQAQEIIVSEKTKTEEMILEIQKNFQNIIACKTVLSPVKGLSFEQLKESQSLLFMLPFQTDEEKIIAKNLGAVGKDGTNMPITAEFLKLVIGGKSEYHLFAKGPNGVLLRAFEERPVKLAVPTEKKIVEEDESLFKSTFIVNLIIFFVFILVGALIFIFFFH